MAVAWLAPAVCSSEAVRAATCLLMSMENLLGKEGARTRERDGTSAARTGLAGCPDGPVSGDRLGTGCDLRGPTVRPSLRGPTCAARPGRSSGWSPWQESNLHL